MENEILTLRHAFIYTLPLSSLPSYLLHFWPTQYPGCTFYVMQWSCTAEYKHLVFWLYFLFLFNFSVLPKSNHCLFFFYLLDFLGFCHWSIPKLFNSRVSPLTTLPQPSAGQEPRALLLQPLGRAAAQPSAWIFLPPPAQGFPLSRLKWRPVS